MIPEAQAAAESAWALGKQTEELAELRIRTYAQEAAMPQNGWLAMNPTKREYAPQASKLDPAIHALHLYQQSFRNLMSEGRARTNRSTLSLDFLCLSADLLRRFYYHPEICDGCGEQLSELRLLCRETLSTVGNQPLNRTLSPPHHRMFLYGDRDLYWEETPSLAQVELGVGTF